MNPQETFYCNKNNPRSHPTKRVKNPRVHRKRKRKERNPTSKNSRSQMTKCSTENPRSAVVKTNSVFYSVLVVM